MPRLVRRAAQRMPKSNRLARRGRLGRKRVAKKAGLSPMNQYAKVVETFEAPDLISDKAYQATFSLADFYRATTVAKNFQFYKAAKVKWEYMPLYNTFQQSNSVAVVSKPQMYFVMNRDQNPYWANNGTTQEARFAIISTGADPVAFTKNREIVYTPNWCSPGISALTFSAVSGVGGGAVNAVTNVIALGLKKQFGWLPTPDLDDYLTPSVYNPTTAPTGMNTAPTANAGVIYNGHNLYIEQENEPNVPVCKVVCTVEWLFKGPKNNYSIITGAQVAKPTE